MSRGSEHIYAEVEGAESVYLGDRTPSPFFAVPLKSMTSGPTPSKLIEEQFGSHLGVEFQVHFAKFGKASISLSFVASIMVFGWSKARIAEAKYRALCASNQNSSSPVDEASTSREPEDTLPLVERSTVSTGRKQLSRKIASMFRRKSNGSPEGLASSSANLLDEPFDPEQPRETKTGREKRRSVSSLESTFRMRRKKKLFKRQPLDEYAKRRQQTSRDSGWEAVSSHSSSSLQSLTDQRSFAATSTPIAAAASSNNRPRISERENSGIIIRRKMFELSDEASGKSMKVPKFGDDSDAVDDKLSAQSDSEGENGVTLARGRPKRTNFAWSLNDLMRSLKKDENCAEKLPRDVMGRSRSVSRDPVSVEQRSEIVEGSSTGESGSSNAEAAKNLSGDDTDDSDGEVRSERHQLFVRNFDLGGYVRSWLSRSTEQITHNDYFSCGGPSYTASLNDLPSASSDNRDGPLNGRPRVSSSEDNNENAEGRRLFLHFECEREINNNVFFHNLNYPYILTMYV